MRNVLLRRVEGAWLAWADIVSEYDRSGRLTIRRSETDPEATAGMYSPSAPLPCRT